MDGAAVVPKAHAHLTDPHDRVVAFHHERGSRALARGSSAAAPPLQLVGASIPPNSSKWATVIVLLADRADIGSSRSLGLQVVPQPRAGAGVGGSSLTTTS